MPETIDQILFDFLAYLRSQGKVLVNQEQLGHTQQTGLVVPMQEDGDLIAAYLLHNETRDW